MYVLAHIENDGACNLSMFFQGFGREKDGNRPDLCLLYIFLL